jgi:hypothetical protein
MRKKKVLYHSDSAIAKTGFGKISRNILSYLYKTGKYDLVHYCCGSPASHPDLQRTPWRSIGTIFSTQSEIDNWVSQFPPPEREIHLRNLSYGQVFIDKVIHDERPDIYIGAQDIWAFNSFNVGWWNKPTCVIWTTLDSLPLLPYAVENAPKIKNYWMWSSFATKEMHRLGHKHVQTMHGPMDVSNFKRLADAERAALRKENNIEQNAFIGGFVFRNQLRKSVPNLLEGYKLWKQNRPTLKNTYLLFHTSMVEGWNIPRLVGEYGINHKEILLTYICKNCKRYQIKSYDDRTDASQPLKIHDKPCKYCGAQDSLVTPSVHFGVDERQLNEIYNFMDMEFCCISSGGQELTIMEAKLTGLITAVTNYSCGEEACMEGAASLPLDWSEYREHGTEFRKASTLPSSIAKQLNKVYDMPQLKRREMGEQAREWTIKNYALDSIGLEFEKFIDAAPFLDENVTFDVPKANPEAVISDVENDAEWVTLLYRNVLGREPDQEGFNNWMKQLV